MTSSSWKKFLTRLLVGLVYGTISYIVFFLSLYLLSSTLFPLLSSTIPAFGGAPGNILTGYPISLDLSYPIYPATFIGIAVVSSLLSGTFLSTLFSMSLTVIFFALFLQFIGFGTITLTVQGMTVTLDFKPLTGLWIASLIIYLIADGIKSFEKL